MQNTPNKASMFISVLALVALAMPAIAADEDLANQVDIPYEMFRLANGLTIIVYSDHSSPTIFVGMWYGVGSKDEP